MATTAAGATLFQLEEAPLERSKISVGCWKGFAKRTSLLSWRFHRRSLVSVKVTYPLCLWVLIAELSEVYDCNIENGLSG